MSNNNPDKDTQETPEDTAPEEAPEETPEDTEPEETPEETPDTEPEETPESTPEEEETSEEAPEDTTPQETPEQTPGSYQEPGTEGSTPPEQEGGGIIRKICNKIGFGYIALIILIAVVILFGFRNRILHYFSGEQKTQAPKPTISDLQKQSPIVPSAHQIQTTQQPVQSPQVQTTQQPSQMQMDQQPTQQPTTSNQATQPITSPQTLPQPAMTEDAVKMIVQDFIMNNPEVIMESLTKLEKRTQEQQAKKSQEYLNKSGDSISKGKPFIGNKNGTIRMVEFFDYRCIHCHKVYPKLIKLTKAYPNLKIALIPLPFMGAASTKATRFSLAVNNLYPNKFRAFHSDLIKTKAINDQTVFQLIRKHKMNKNKLIKEANSDKIDRVIKENLKLAQKSGVQGVPSFIINGEFIPGAASYSEFKKKIDIINTSG